MRTRPIVLLLPKLQGFLIDSEKVIGGIYFLCALRRTNNMRTYLYNKIEMIQCFTMFPQPPAIPATSNIT